MAIVCVSVCFAFHSLFCFAVSHCSLIAAFPRTVMTPITSARPSIWEAITEPFRQMWISYLLQVVWAWLCQCDRGRQLNGGALCDPPPALPILYRPALSHASVFWMVGFWWGRSSANNSNHLCGAIYWSKTIGPFIIDITICCKDGIGRTNLCCVCHFASLILPPPP